MADFIAEIVGQESSDEGNIVVVRVTGFGDAEAALMTRAKAKAITATRFGSETARSEFVTDKFDIETGRRSTERRDVFADKSEELFTGPASDVRDRLQAFRKEGLFATVKDIKPLKTERIFDNETLEEAFGPLKNAVSTYEYRVLVTTRYSISDLRTSG